MEKIPKLQKILSESQLEAFYHSDFVGDQIENFGRLLDLKEGNSSPNETLLVDMGGGVGFFAQAIREKYGLNVRVVDLDARSVALCKGRGVDAVLGDVLNYPISGKEAIVSFNLILHHLVGPNLKLTRELQLSALKRWANINVKVFINEYIYESFVPSFSGVLIFLVTSSNFLSKLANFVSKFVPALKANTFGVGVRFRSKAEWIRLFRDAGFDLVGAIDGKEERVDWPLRMLLIRSIRRSSFLLISRSQTTLSLF